MVHWRDIMSTLEDIMVHWRDIMSTPGGNHDKCGGRSLGKQLNLYGNPSVLNISRCTHDIPQCTEHPLAYCTPPVYYTDIMQGGYRARHHIF